MESPRHINDGAAALERMEEALVLLDRWDRGPEVGAQLDLAICRLRTLLGLGARKIDESALEFSDVPSGRSSSSFAA